MAIVLLFMSLLSGITGASIALYWGLSWILAIGAYALCGIIGTLTFLVIFVALVNRRNLQQDVTSQSVVQPIR